MKKNYMKPEMELVNVLATQVIAVSIGFGEDYDPNGGTIEDAPEFHF